MNYQPVSIWVQRENEEELRVEGEYSPGEPETRDGPGAPASVVFLRALDLSGDEVEVSPAEEAQWQTELENRLDEYEKGLPVNNDPLPPKNRTVVQSLAPFMNDRREPRLQRQLIRRLIRRFMQRHIKKQTKNRK